MKVESFFSLLLQLQSLCWKASFWPWRLAWDEIRKAPLIAVTYESNPTSLHWEIPVLQVFGRIIAAGSMKVECYSATDNIHKSVLK
jgi:hypothetical protein